MTVEPPPARLLPAALAGSDIAAWRGAEHAHLGMALLGEGRGGEALVALRGAVAFGDLRPATLLNLALAEEQAGDPELARASMRALGDRLPDWDEPPLRLGESLRRAGDLAAAEAAYERAVELNPQRPEALLSLAALLMLRHQAPRAQMLLLRCCARAPDRADAWDALGLALMLTGDIPAAESAFGEAQRLLPDNIDIAVRRAEAAALAGNAAAELARLDLAAADDPANVALLTARGVLLGRQGQRDEAVDVLEAAVALAPDALVPIVALSNALTTSSRARMAVDVLRRAVALAPDDSNLRNNLAATLVRVHRYDEARAILEVLIDEHGPQLNFLCNLTNALVSLGLQEQGVARARQAVALMPQAHLAWRALGNALSYHPDVTGQSLLAAYRGVGRTMPRTTPVALANTRDPARRLRLGLLSPTLKTHPVGWLTVAGFETLDPDAFEIICLGPPESTDPIQRRFRAAAAEWHVVDTETPAALAQRIRDLGIDILVELSGYGDRGLIAACAHRPAPVQVKWVGMQNHSTGLAEMDWIITDRWETPAGFERHYSERLLHLPDGYVCYSPPPYAPDLVALPALRRGHVTFGCFNNTAKITPVVIAAWARVLRAVPGARLVLKAHQFAEPATAARFCAAFADHGIDAARLELRAGSPHRALLAEYGDIDVVLDPFPYSGGLTTCEALWMGVPTVTLPGETFASRHSASHMSNAGLADWVVADLDAYVARAAAAAGDLAALAALRAGLRARLRASPLCDAPRFGRNLGAALRRAWHDWCAAEPATTTPG
ncbi:MAG: tetratricopeptide repeat protein [Acetobacteraceae bacterium]|nr:tetratricopeptide repeat protein [Acetobacteraceae bacterium]